MNISQIRDMSAAQGRRTLDELASKLEQYASYAREKGNEPLQMVITHIETAMRSASLDIAAKDVLLAENVAAKAVCLLVTFHCLYPEFQKRTVH